LSTTERRARGRSTAIADGLAFTARWSVRLTLIGIALAGLWWVIAELWVIVMPVLLALLLASVLAPLARRLRNHGAPPALAAAAVVLGLLLLLAITVFFLARSIRGGFSEIAASAVQGLQSIQDWIAGPPLNIGSTQFNALLDQVTQRLQSSVTTIASSVLTGVGTLAGLVTTALLAVVLAFLFVKDGELFLPWVRRIVGPRAGGHLSVVSCRVWDALGGFIRAQVIVSLVDGFFIGVGLLIVGVPLALPLAVITFFGGFIPIIGALIAGVLSVLVALVSNGFTAALIVLGIVLLVQQLEGNVMQPILQGKSLQLHAAVVLLAVTAGGTLFGIGGAFLAVPVTAAVVALLRYLLEQVDKTSEDDQTDAPGDAEAAAAAGVRPAPDPERRAAQEQDDGPPTSTPATSTPATTPATPQPDAASDGASDGAATVWNRIRRR